MIPKLLNRACLVGLSLILLLGSTAWQTIQPVATLAPIDGAWSGLTSRAYPMSFTVALSGTQWSMFKLKTDFVATKCYNGVGAIEVTVQGPGPIANNTFSYTSSTFSFSGQFDTASTASGTYTFTNRPIVIGLPFPPYVCYDTLTQSGTWTVSVPITVSGNVGANDAIMSYTDGMPKTVKADGVGNYSITVLPGWSGNVTPSHPCFTFNPPNLSYSSITANQTSQNYTATFNNASSCANVNILINGINQGQFGVPLHSGTRAKFAGANNGPLKLLTLNAVPLIGAERVIYTVGGVNTSYTEMMGLPNTQLNNIYWLPWYNNLDLDTQLRIGNVSGSAATIHIFIGGTEVTPVSGMPLAAGASTRLSYPGVNSGPVQIQSNVNIVAAERVIYKVNGINTSFAEMMALPNSQLTNLYWLPWYNNADLDTQLRIGNVSNLPATVHIFIGGAEVTPPTGIPLAVGASTRVSYPGVNSGPVKIQSDQNVVAAERVIYKVNGVNTSFTELMALPNSQLNAVYWLPWYNTADLDSQLRFGNVSGATAHIHVFIGGTEMPNSPFTLGVGQSTRVSFAGVNSGPVKIQSDQPIVAAERVIYKVNGTPTSFSEMMALPNSQLTPIYWWPFYNNVDLDTQLRFAAP